jgi:hypothetical protein
MLSTKEERVFVPQTSICKNNTMSPTPLAPAPKPYIGSVSIWWPEDETGDPETNVRKESKMKSGSDIISRVTREGRCSVVKWMGYDMTRKRPWKPVEA